MRSEKSVHDFSRNYLPQIQFYLRGILVFRETNTLRHPAHVGVNNDRRFAVSKTNDHVRRFPPYAFDRRKGVNVVRHLSSKPFLNLLSNGLKTLGLVPVEACRPYVLLQLLLGNITIVAPFRIFLEKMFRYTVDSLIRTLS